MPLTGLWLPLAAVSFPLATTAPCDRAEFVVAIDVGHTSAAGGTTSARGVPEFEFNLRMAKLLEERLTAAGFDRVAVINGDGAIGGLELRAEAANAMPANLFISIHHDSLQPHYLETWRYAGESLDYSDRFRGFSIFTSGLNGERERSLEFAGMLGDELLGIGLEPTLHHAEPIPGENRDLLDRKRGIYAFDELNVLKTTAMPAVLLECGVIKNRDEEAILNDPAYRLAMADAIVAAIDRFRAERCQPASE